MELLSTWVFVRLGSQTIELATGDGELDAESVQELFPSATSVSMYLSFFRSNSDVESARLAPNPGTSAIPRQDPMGGGASKETESMTSGSDSPSQHERKSSEHANSPGGRTGKNAAAEGSRV